MASEENVGQQFSVYRSEHRPPGADLSQPESIGVHWTRFPRDFGYAHQPGNKRVVWHGTVDAEHVAETNDRYNEGEVVVRSGAQVRVTGRTERTDKRGHVDVVPGAPEHPMDLVVPVRGRQIK